MIPLRDTIPSQRFPLMTIGLIVVNSAIFIYQLTLDASAEVFMNRFALTPAAVQYYFSQGNFLLAAIPFFSSMFLHGGWMHLLGNMLFLWIFADNVEDKMGHSRFLTFYLVCGLAAAALQMYSSPNSPVPIVGASGAIAGVLGAYFLLFPKSRILTLVPIFFFITTIEIPAFLFLGIWFLLQILNGTISLSADNSAGGVAWWAHTGGFFAGMLLVFPFRKFR